MWLLAGLLERSRGMAELERDIEKIVEESRFSGAVRIDCGDEVVVERAYGLAR